MCMYKRAVGEQACTETTCNTTVSHRHSSMQFGTFVKPKPYAHVAAAVCHCLASAGLVEYMLPLCACCPSAALLLQCGFSHNELPKN